MVINSPGIINSPLIILSKREVSIPVFQPTSNLLNYSQLFPNTLRLSDIFREDNHPALLMCFSQPTPLWEAKTNSCWPNSVAQKPWWLHRSLLSHHILNKEWTYFNPFLARNVFSVIPLTGSTEHGMDRYLIYNHLISLQTFPGATERRQSVRSKVVSFDSCWKKRKSSA